MANRNRVQAERMFGTTSGTPEQRLFVAVIAQAVRDLQSVSQDREAVTARRDAIRWFSEAGPDYYEVCAAAGADPYKLQRMYRDGTLDEVRINVT